MGIEAVGGGPRHPEGGIDEHPAVEPSASPGRGAGAGDARTTVEPYRPQVELCTRTADLPIVRWLGVQHHWLRTPAKEVGMGERTGREPGRSWTAPLGVSTQWVDHSKEKDKTCVAVPDVDAACVERETGLGKDTGTWVPFLNDCHTRTREVLERCATRPGARPRS